MRDFTHHKLSRNDHLRLIITDFSACQHKIKSYISIELERCYAYRTLTKFTCAHLHFLDPIYFQGISIKPKCFEATSIVQSCKMIQEPK